MKYLMLLLLGLCVSIAVYFLEKDQSFEEVRREPQSQGLLFKTHVAETAPETAKVSN